MVGIAADLIEDYAQSASDYTTDVPDYTLSMFDYIPDAIGDDYIIASDYGDTDQGEWMSGCFTM